MPEKPGPEVFTFSQKERKSHLTNFGHLMYDTDAGLLIQNELVSNYQQVEGLVLGTGVNGENITNISPYYSNGALKMALCALINSNLLASPVWKKLGLKGILDPISQEDTEIGTYFLNLIAREKFSRQVPPNEKDLDILLTSIQDQGLVTGNYDPKKARAEIMLDWQHDWVGISQIMRRLFRAGAEDVDLPDNDYALKNFPNDADWIYIFHVMKLITSLNLMTEGLKKLDASPKDVDQVFRPHFKKWPCFSRAYSQAGYVAWEAAWTHDWQPLRNLLGANDYGFGWPGFHIYAQTSHQKSI